MSPFTQMQIAAVLLLVHLGLYLLLFARAADRGRGARAAARPQGRLLARAAQPLPAALRGDADPAQLREHDRRVRPRPLRDRGGARQRSRAAVAQRARDCDEKALLRRGALVHRRVQGQLPHRRERHRARAAGVRRLAARALRSASRRCCSSCRSCSLGSYSLAAVGASLSLVRWVKTAENGADYSVMNSAKQMLWLPTSREEKYKAKQAIDTFFVRTGDMTAAGFVFAGDARARPRRARVRAREHRPRGRLARPSRGRCCARTAG